MSLDLLCSSDDASDLALARRRLAEASSRLRAALGAALALADRTDWQTPAALRFHARVDGWRGDLSNLAGSVDAADDEAWWLQLRLAVRADGRC